MVQTTEYTFLHFTKAKTLTWPDYAAYLERLLAGGVTAVPHPLLYYESEISSWPQLFALRRVRQLAPQPAQSVLVVQQPSWPLHHILLVVRGEVGDETAVIWAKILAQASGADVTILPIIPPYPGMYQMGNKVQADLNILLQPNTTSGQRLLHYEDQLSEANVTNHFCQQSGTPDRQVWQAVNRLEPDMIVVGKEKYGRLYRWLLGEIVTPLLRWVDRPLLIAK
ncbi:MAG: universal stress protein [Ardenticatenaceae bacterium]|nr:universal stress protein [Ardenticatenaceae bacterium]